MDLNIIANKENKTIGRREIEFSAFADAGVKRDDLKAELCKKLNLSPASTIIVRIDSGYGSRMPTGIAHSYASEEALKKYESRRLLERLGVVQKEARAAAAAPAAEPEPAAKPEEKK